MKRSMKNVLMITIIALLSIGMVFTYSYAKSNVASMNGGTPPSMPGSSSDNNSSSSNSIPKNQVVVMR